MNPYGLTAEQRHEPLGLGEPRPRLSWKLASDRRGALQAAYRITAAERREDLHEPSRLCWDSGRPRCCTRTLRLASGHYSIRAAAPASLPPVT